LRAEVNAQFASLAAVRDEIDLAAGYVDIVDVERFTIKYSHQAILSISMSLWIQVHYTGDLITGN